MFRGPRLVPPSQPHCETSVSPRYRLSVSLIFQPLTVNHSSLGFLSRIDAKLTRVNHNPFVCRSYKKHPGWGMLSPPYSLARPAYAQQQPQHAFFHGVTSYFHGYQG